MQLALELVEAQHSATDCDAALAAQHAQLREAKAAQQAHMAAGLDARLQAALAALDASGRSVGDWQKAGASLLREYAAMLQGTAPLPGVRQICVLHVGHVRVCCSMQAHPAQLIQHCMTSHALLMHPSGTR